MKLIRYLIISIIIFYSTGLQAKQTGKDVLKVCKEIYENRSEDNVANSSACRFYMYGVLDQKILRLGVMEARIDSILTAIKNNKDNKGFEINEEMLVIEILAPEYYNAINSVQLGFCQKDIGYDQLIKVAYKYVLENPKEEHLLANVLMAKAWREAFPYENCTKNKTEKEIAKDWEKAIEMVRSIYAKKNKKEVK